MKSLKKFFALCLTLALALSLAACAQKPAETTDPAETPDTPEQEVEAPVTARIAALKGPTAMGLVKLMSDAPSSANGPLYDFTLAGSADEVTPALIKGELDMACVPANLAAVLYNKTEGAVQVLAVNTPRRRRDARLEERAQRMCRGAGKRSGEYRPAAPALCYRRAEQNRRSAHGARSHRGVG